MIFFFLFSPDDAIIKIINDNWETLLQPIVSTLENQLGSQVRDSLNINFFSKVPIEDLALPDEEWCCFDFLVMS